jgi:hypothetical protein
MLFRLILAIAIVCGTIELSSMPASAERTLPSYVIAYGTVAMFDTEAAAQTHCPSDVVVWLNTKTGIWHEKGMRWYGHTKEGAYVCRKEAAAAGYRDTRNGQ